ncbi:hypothetical protein HOP50_16g78680 [Chloropicon primus]|uniref:Importin N-terminal domain-containing protein n=1 Tax=Chloropicon primus TaxID=1764295 RepID=A0A5B8N0K1_9CHLO|nr:hypothetical protein A3770_16p78380 [Chloropicon primus]UPR04526.1 hypothetical protein HOP50_16g78680 [Chloropicon primus]|mmetsp:Transcript_13381/g.37573  ORF Transcript_13381/g.37573 Transcript_13381/m.37573 type:complete len:1077 (-) Transcript_13381:132-3362(-)|eukprot:QDZ25320.1 hypothetical protein A3770_16p78380 [Chloropicon primus]
MASSPGSSHGGTISAEGVVDVLTQSMSQDGVARDRALRALEHWQRDHCRGILPALLEIIQSKALKAVDPMGLRLYAAVMAKNLVGCAWDRSSSSSFGRTFAEKREWNGIDNAEKNALKEGLLCMLFAEKDARVREQLVVLVATVARYELPGGWPSLLGELMDAANHQDLFLEERNVALRALKKVLAGLKGKKALLSVTSAELLRDRAKLQNFARTGALEMQSLQSSIKAVAVALHQLWKRGSSVLGSGDQGWDCAGLVANASLSCMRQVILVLESFDGVSDTMSTFFAEAAQQAEDLRNVYIEPPAGTPASQDVDRWREMANKSFVVINKCCIAAVDKHAREFAPLMIPFMRIYIESIMALDHGMLQVLSQKRLVLMTRFLAKVFHNPTYKRSPGLLQRQMTDAGDEAHLKIIEGMQVALRYIGEFWESPVFSQFVEALITRFLVLTDEELQEWESDPENFFLVSNLDLDIESEVRRCCAEALLLFLMERNTEATSRVVMTLASQSLNPEASFGWQPRLVEGCLHAIDATALLIPTGTLNYDAFFCSDAMRFLEMPSSDVVTRTLQGRVLHMLVTMSAELSAESYEKALEAALKFLQSPDIVLALNSVTLLHKLCVADIIGRGPYAKVHSRLLKAHVTEMLSSSFLLAHKLNEGENLQAVLRLIAIEVEALVNHGNLFDASGEAEAERAKTMELIQFLAVQMPQVWQRILNQGGGESGYGAACQSSLINILLLLIEKVGEICLAVNPLREVVFELIGFCVNIGAPHSEYLLEDGLKLWRTVMLYGSWQSIGQPVQSSVGDLFCILQSGRENHEALCVLKLYVVLCGPQVLADRSQLLKALMDHCLSAEGTVKEVYTALDFLYTLALVDLQLAFHVSQQGMAYLLQKLKNQELVRAVLEPLLSLLALFALRNESLLSGLAFGIVDEMTKILLTYKGIRSIHEFLNTTGARGSGFMKRKVAFVLLAFVAKYFPDLGRRHKRDILEFGLSQAQEEDKRPLSVAAFLNVKGSLTQVSDAEVWRGSEYFNKAKAVYETDPIFALSLRDLLHRTAEALVSEEDGGNGVDALLGSLNGLNMSQ